MEETIKKRRRGSELTDEYIIIVEYYTKDGQGVSHHEVGYKIFQEDMKRCLKIISEGLVIKKENYQFDIIPPNRIIEVRREKVD